MIYRDDILAAKRHLTQARIDWPGAHEDDDRSPVRRMFTLIESTIADAENNAVEFSRRVEVDPRAAVEWSGDDVIAAHVRLRWVSVFLGNLDSCKTRVEADTWATDYRESLNCEVHRLAEGGELNSSGPFHRAAAIVELHTVTRLACSAKMWGAV